MTCSPLNTEWPSKDTEGQLDNTRQQACIVPRWCPRLALSSTGDTERTTWTTCLLSWSLHFIQEPLETMLPLEVSLAWGEGSPESFKWMQDMTHFIIIRPLWRASVAARVRIRFFFASPGPAGSLTHSGYSVNICGMSAPTNRQRSAWEMLSKLQSVINMNGWVLLLEDYYMPSQIKAKQTQRLHCVTPWGEKRS